MALPYTTTNLSGLRAWDYPELSHEMSRGLERLVVFPGVEEKSPGGVPNSTVWAYRWSEHQFNSEILKDDVGCGMAAFIMPTNGDATPSEIADIVYDKLSGKNILGRGNHFVDICGELKLTVPAETTGIADDAAHHYTVLVLHTDGKREDKSIPKSVAQAKNKEDHSKEFRITLGEEIGDAVGIKTELLGDWTHNSVREEGELVVYRKGVIQITPDNLYMLPAHMGSPILFYTPANGLPPFNSMPHATGRSKSKGDGKVSLDAVHELRKKLYIPSEIEDTSLRTEHPSCFNSLGRILVPLAEYMQVVGQATVKAYVGKV